MDAICMEPTLTLDRRNKIQNYINNFRILLSQHLKPNIGIETTAIPFDKGSLIEFELGENEKNLDKIKTLVKSAREALRRANVQIGDDDYNIHTVNIGGTNIIVYNNKIYLIKDDSAEEWTKEQAEKDVDKILQNT